jgi:hypothetical protein
MDVSLRGHTDFVRCQIEDKKYLTKNTDLSNLY